FGYGIRRSDILASDYSPNITLFHTTKKYALATGEAKRAAEVIVAAEKVRLKLFLEALQGTLRFFDHLTSNPQYQEAQLQFDVNTKRDILAKELVAFLTSLLGDTIPVQEEPEQKSGEKIRIVEGEITLPATVTLRLRKEEHS